MKEQKNGDDPLTTLNQATVQVSYNPAITHRPFEGKRVNSYDSRSVMLYGDPRIPGTSGTWSEITTLSEDKYEEYRNSLWSLDSLLRRSHFAYFRAACLDFINQVEEAGERVANGSIPGSGDDSIELLSSKFIRSLLAISSLIKFEQDKSLERIQRSRGENSEEHIRATKEYSHLYDENFGYRFLSRLRNIMHHDTMEVIRFSATASATPSGNIGVCEVRLERSAFLDSQRINNSLKRDLRELEDDPLVIEMVVQSLLGLAGLNRFLRPYAYPDLDQYCASIREFEALFQGAPGLRCLADGQIAPRGDSFSIPNHMSASPDVLSFAHGLIPDLPNIPEMDIPRYDRPEYLT